MYFLGTDLYLAQGKSIIN